ncbi:MAG: glutamate--tRNA ligase [Acidimicrobiales bacterium]
MREVVPEAGDLPRRGVSTSPDGPPRRVRVRIAPSPTGYFHVGSGRTALYNWAFARQHGGDFVLRIEDTDAERNREEWVGGILDALTWLGTEWDEGPYRQSERSELYRLALDDLSESGAVYACDCQREDVLERTKDNATPGYDGFCRDRGLERGAGRALRFRVPEDGTTVVRDVIRGDVEFANRTIEDFVVQKSNGDALFVLAVVVDDRDMGISHVIRAEEHLPTTPKAVMLWEALNAADPKASLDLPAFAHLPVLVNERRQKISKRRDRVALEDYEALGYLPEAMCNYLALLGWSCPSGEELFSKEDLVRDFRLEDVNHSPAFFDEQKLSHLNGVYIRSLSVEEFTGRVRAWAAATGDELGTTQYGSESWQVLAPLVQERVATLGEVPAYVAFLYSENFAVEGESFEKAVTKDELAPQILAEVEERLSALSLSQWNAAVLKDHLLQVGEAHGRKLGKAQAPVRVATLGRTVGLPLFESLEVLGKEATLERLRAALSRLSIPAKD